MAKHGILLASRGFTLLELLIVTVILGVLAAIAVPLFQGMQARAHQAETVGNLAGIHVAEVAYYSEWNRYFMLRKSRTMASLADTAALTRSDSPWLA
jgi:prepilin-type N-terminal cleavage/methylation domain-containing protein